MKKLTTYFTIFFISFIVHNALAMNRVFLLDTSKSMLNEGLFSRIKETLKNNYVSKMRPNEHIILLGFDEEITIFVDKKIEKVEDIEEVNKQIDALKADGKWTWMTKALEMTTEQAKRLKAQQPKEGLGIYFLTDGINDPPPVSKEPPLKISDALLKYFRDFRLEDSYVYVLLFKGKNTLITPEKQNEIEKETEGKVKIDARSRTLSNPIPPEIRIGHPDFDFGIINLSRGDATETARIGIKELRGDAQGKIVKLRLKTESLPQPNTFRIKPDSFKVIEEGQRQDITLYVSQETPPGEYVLPIKLSSEDVFVSPDEIPLKLSTKKGTEQKESQMTEQEEPDEEQYDWEWLWKLIAAILGILTLYFLLLIFRRKTLWVQKDTQGKFHKISIKNTKKCFLSNIGFPDYHLKFGTYPHEIFSVFLFKNSEIDKKITAGEYVICEDAQGNNVTVTFYDESPKLDGHETDNNEAYDTSFFEREQKEENPDFFKEEDSDPDFFK